MRRYPHDISIMPDPVFTDATPACWVVRIGEEQLKQTFDTLEGAKAAAVECLQGVRVEAKID
jgi:hypothetical protein